ncbi:hypothetical protein [Pararhodobacter sp.]|uniref:hypothetical protein n=1 Tax=Pararhodobacter sp. TaxID=2127056 RepID=UPI002AFE78AD|nr:hypothetical protein [Pararhodobacter sp.]
MAVETDPVTLVHRAVADLVAPWFDPKKWMAPAVIGLPMTPDEFRRLSEQTPRMHLGWEGFKANGEMGRMFAGTLSFRLMAVIKNSERSNVHMGDRHGPGLYPVVMALGAALHGQTIENVGTIQVTDANQANIDGWKTLGAAAGIVSFNVHTSLGDLLGAGADAPAFTRLVSSFDAPGLEVEDVISLPGATP